MSEIRERISEDLKTAMKAKEADKVSTLRMIKTEIVKKETEGSDSKIDEAGLLKLLNTMKKQREESIAIYDKEDRKDLADNERKELEIIESYLPKSLSKEEMEKIVEEAISETGAENMKAMGQVMKVAMAKTQGRANGKQVSALVREKLGK